MDTEPRGDQPAEGLLLEQARDRMGISQNEAARRAGFTGTRWRQIVYEVATTMTSSRGVRTLARMAEAVGVTAEQLGDAGRADVAAQLREQESEPQPTVEQLAARLAELEEANARQAQVNAENAQVNAELRRLLDELTGNSAHTRREAL